MRTIWMKLRKKSLSWLVAIAASVCLPRAHAQTAETAATALFDEGRKLMTQHLYAEACPKFAESQRLAPSGGTLLNLADCYEHLGKTASAWVAWKDAAARANAAGKADVEKKALGRAQSLEPNLARLTVAIAADSHVSGLEVRRDGVPVGAAEYGLEIPVDPGKHTVDARAPNKKEWSTTIDVAAKQTDARVTVSLEDERAPVALPAAEHASTTPAAAAPLSGPPAEQSPSPATGNGQRIAALITLGLGVAGLGVGSAFGLVAMSKNNEALKPENCRTSTMCSPEGLALTSDAKDAATASTIAFAIGGAAVAAGVVLWLTSPRSAPAAHVTAAIDGSSAGISLLGAW